jgi:hypothetical protein
MSRGLDIPKASPESVARAIFDGVEKGEEDTFPDPMSESMAEGWRSGAAKASRALSRERHRAHVFERVVAACMAEGLVKGEGFAIDASAIKESGSRCALRN